MLTAAAAAKISPGQQNRCPCRFRLVQFKFRIRRLTVAQIPPVIEQKRPVSRSLNPLEELLGNDLIRIDVRPVHAGDKTGVGRERLHYLCCMVSYYCSST